MGLATQPGLALVIAQTVGANTERYIHAPRGIHTVENQAGNWSYLLQDGLGSVRGEISASGTMLGSRSHAPYGTISDSTGTFSSSFGYAGEQIDGSGLSYNRLRYYAPALGSFPSLDIIEAPNQYTYAFNNPINFVDPSGLHPCFIPPVAFGCAAALVAGVVVAGGVVAASNLANIASGNMGGGFNNNTNITEGLFGVGFVQLGMSLSNALNNVSGAVFGESHLRRTGEGPIALPGGRPNFDPKDVEKFATACGAAFFALLSSLTGARVTDLQKIDVRKKCNPSEVLLWKHRLQPRSIISHIVANDPAYLYQFSITHDYNEYIATNGIVSVRADGIRESDCYFVDTKFVKSPDKSPYMPNSTAAAFLREIIRLDIIDQIARYTALIYTPSVPIVGLEINTNEPAASLFFQAFLTLTPGGRVIVR